MAVPILATKLFAPPPRSQLVLRPRLIDHLHKGLRSNYKLTIISAPAGFGKTTLVSEWIANSGKPFAWLSLDEGDKDPARFISYLIAALQTIQEGVGEGLLSALKSHQPPAIESILTTLLNEITAIPDNFILVLDDYHIIDSKPVDDALAFLLEHQPPKMHLVIATREDPNLPLARLRARGQLTEVRAADLRFTPAETAEFLNQMMGLNLSDGDIAALEARTEGWIAGLQMAALSMQGRQDIPSFIQAFAGSHRFVLDYLVEEVLERQPERIRSFLLQSAILDRFCAPLCNAVMEWEDGNEMLEVLEHSNLFVISLDDQRQWYRYHHLFAEVLQSHLRQERSDQVSILHQRASAWYEQNGLQADAIRHALAAKDFDRAADLIEKIWRAMDLNYQYATWLGWVKALPEDVIRARPVVSVGYAWALLGIGELEASETRLRDAERWLEPVDKQAEDSPAKSFPESFDYPQDKLRRRMVVVDEAEFRSLPASIAAARAYRALALGDISGTKMYARQTLALVPDDITPQRTQATALLALAEYACGDLQAADREFLKFQAMMWQINDIASAIGITFVLANIKLAQGRLREAVSAYRQSLQLARNRGASFFIGVSDLHRGLSELLCEQGDLEGAAQHLQTAQQLSERGATTGWPHRLCFAQARLKESQGNLAEALVLLEEAERQYVRNPLPDPPVTALKARTWVRQGRLTDAFSWAREQNLSPDDDLGYLREFEHLTLARALIARYKSDQADDDLHVALGLLARLLQAAEEGERKGSVIDILIQQSLAYQAQGDQPRALASLERALTLAEPEGYVRIFVDEGQAMQSLISSFRLTIATHTHHLLGYIDRILDFFPQTVANRTHTKIASRKSKMVEPLTDRELEVLRLIAEGQSNAEISQQLFLALSTVKGHNLRIFNKLQAQNRTEAVARARELGLL